MKIALKRQDRLPNEAKQIKFHEQYDLILVLYKDGYF